MHARRHASRDLGYVNAHAAQGRAWVEASIYEAIDVSYLQRLAHP